MGKAFPHSKAVVAYVLVTVTICYMVTSVGTFTRLKKFALGTLGITLCFLALGGWICNYLLSMSSPYPINFLGHMPVDFALLHTK